MNFSIPTAKQVLGVRCAEALEELVLDAILSPNPDDRTAMIYVIMYGLRNQPYHLSGGFADQDRVYLSLSSVDHWGLLYICDLPKEHRDKEVTQTFPFKKEDVDRLMAKYKLNFSRK